MQFRRRIDINSEDDPLSRAIAPPPNETQEEKDTRIAAEAEAQKRSDAIDEEINRQRTAEKKSPKFVRVLLLGQSESGKSTTLKNFQLINSPKAFRDERASWRAVVQLNVVRSIQLILNTMAEVQGQGSPRPDNLHTLTPEHLKLRMRLLPLHQVEEALLRKLTPPGSIEFEATHLSSAVTNFNYATRSARTRKEIAVNSTSQWKGAFSRVVANTVRSSMDSGMDIDFDDPNDPGIVLHACAEDMTRLWNDPTIKGMLKTRKIRLEDKAGFFLDSLDRVTSLKYVPSDDDILRARLKTLGVSEHRFKFKAGNMVAHDWKVFDVGGARSLRAAWAPFFDNMDAIIFLAPISGFDETLAEDPSVNRLEDSILLWKSIVSNPLLQNAQTVLFLNKFDLFRAKLDSGIQFGQHVVSYGNRPNKSENASNYLRKKFANLHKQYSPSPRVLYCHLTSAIDGKSTQSILGNVRDMVLRQYLRESSLV